MSIERAVLVMAGIMVMLTTALGLYHHEYWHYFTAFIGLNMLQSAFTGICPAAMIFKAMGLKAERDLASQS
jgi:hypothetical protein